jgi:cytidyltransferase-like protein
MSGDETTGLIIGKFLPPHTGHQYLIDFARNWVDRLTVLVCSLAAEPIPGAMRHAWMREMFPAVNVVHVEDENPQEPHEHPDFWGNLARYHRAPVSDSPVSVRLGIIRFSPRRGAGGRVHPGRPVAFAVSGFGNGGAARSAGELVLSAGAGSTAFRATHLHRRSRVVGKDAP